MTITSTPPGAMVTLNDIEIGRTPLSKQFVWYGVMEAQVRKPGYQTFDGQTQVIAPWWEWPPIDIVAELLPFKVVDEHKIQYTLKPESQQHVDPEALVERGQRMREQLENSRLPQPATKPATRPSNKSK